jgi:hypothetical protein
MSQTKDRTLAIAVALSILILGSAASVQAATPRYVTGKVYINGSLAPNGVTVRLVFGGQTVTASTFGDGDYRLNFDENNYEKGTFSVSYLGMWRSTTPPTVELGDQNDFGYAVDLHVKVLSTGKQSTRYAK